MKGWFTDDTPKRFEAYGWHVVPNVDGHDFAAVEKALHAAQAETGRPSLICCKTVIGKGSPNKAGTPRGARRRARREEVAATRAHIGWQHPPFEIPQEVYDGWDARVKGAGQEAAWNKRFAAYERDHPELAAEFKRRMQRELPANWPEAARAFIAKTVEKAETIATRKASQNAIEALAAVLPELVGGSADLAGSNLTLWSKSRGMQRDEPGNYIYFGVREFGMAAIMNGIALHGGCARTTPPS